MNITKIRPSHHNNNEISFLWTPSEKLVELVHTSEGLQFAVRKGAQPIEYMTKFEDYSPISWLEDYLRTGALRLPTSAAANVNIDDLAKKVRAFIHRYFDCDDRFESVATLYVLHTWVYEQFQAVPYLRFLGLPGSGKTRATEAIGACCYRPLVMAGSATPAPMFRMIESIGGTMLIDEADFRHSQIGSDIIKVLNCGYQSKLPVTRMEKNDKGDFVPRVYEVFGPKIINGRRRFQDDATETRCLSYTPHTVKRADIPTQLQKQFETEAMEIQNMALGWRMDNLDGFTLDGENVGGLKGRAKQIAIPLISVAKVMGSDVREKYITDLLAFCAEQERQAEADRQESVEGKLVAAYVSLQNGKQPTCKQIVDAVLLDDGGHDPGLSRWLSPRRAGGIMHDMGFKTHHTNRGSEVTIDSKILSSLVMRFGLTKKHDGGDDGDDRDDAQGTLAGATVTE
jgi:hypothetical protein